MSIKTTLKRNSVFSAVHGNFRVIFRSMLLNLSPTIATKYYYKKSLGKNLNLTNPTEFNEKIQWLKLNWQHPLVSKCGDKYAMREYVESCDSGEILNTLYGVYEDPSQIEWNKLPQKFALKATHGCGFNIICDDKNKLDKEAVLQQLNKWMKVDYSNKNAELHYKKMTPRIICEEYIETDSGFFPDDYKIYCFNGKPQIVLVCTDRKMGYRRSLLNVDWEKIDITKEGYNFDPPNKPKCFDEMLKYAEVLSKPFPFVRVDFYDYNGKPSLGEMTFTPAAGVANYYTDKGSKLLGGMLKLPKPYKQN
ncbi:ATP-grasp fold amidoligase family protein [Rossellomorea aquimaris]|uniref:Glycosyl transferase n=1 Tax=Rossellomorea aquimaris TaxID=189382 RepID=A0A5D4TUX4_9BACI|nr:ATP-grasp fold amidoligase family protein [Rossellomorea aquimaris]TYS78558.1 glycosyl transferase [Rossellomorea aquimaris]